MRKSWLVATSTYRRRVRSGAFLMLTFGLPLLMVIVSGVGILSELRGGLPHVGYVDRTGELSPVQSVAVNGDTLQLRSFAAVDAAEQALETGDIAGYLVIPETYSKGASTTFYGDKSPNARLESGLRLFMRRALLPGAPEWQLKRLDEPASITYVALETGERIGRGLPLVVRVATPAFLAVAFVLTVFASAGQMGSAVVREKEQRAMEMVITSLSPRELIVGKVLGMSLLSLTQMAVWMVGAGLALGVALFGSLELQSLSIPWSALLWATLLGIPGYFLYAVIGAGLGVIAGDKQQARQLAGMLGFLGMFPLYFMSIILDNLWGPLGVGLSFFPLTAPTITLIRMAMTDVPLWQLITSFTVIVASLTASVWFVARIFRAAMLMYGQTLQPKQIMRALRQA